jgi:hypothetical protein
LFALEGIFPSTDETILERAHYSPRDTVALVCRVVSKFWNRRERLAHRAELRQEKAEPRPFVPGRRES